MRLFGSRIRFAGRRNAFSQLLGGDEADADQFALAPDQRAYPPHLAACRQRKAEHLRDGKIANIQAGAVLGNVEDVALDPCCIRRRNQESLLRKSTRTNLRAPKSLRSLAMISPARGNPRSNT